MRVCILGREGVDNAPGKKLLFIVHETLLAVRVDCLANVKPVSQAVSRRGCLSRLVFDAVLKLAGQLTSCKAAFQLLDHCYRS